LGGSFLSGVLATVVATPCAAPFLAPALGAALALPALPSLVLFSAIALGLAAPFLALSAFPEAVRHLPRPGAWMETLKQGLAFLLYAAAAYLVWVLAGQADEARLLAALFSLVLLAVAAWIYGRCQSLAHPPRLRRAGWVTALLLAAAALAFGWPRAASPRELTWEPWSAERVEAALAANRPVYVDFTARWCATCQVNKRVVFGSSQVLKTFRERNVAALKADWTNQDPAITAELARFGRSAVPFNLVYLPGGAEPRVLPEVLTPGVVLDALDGK
jgi:thiol:disulfide interchange protein DsbD